MGTSAGDFIVDKVKKGYYILKTVLSIVLAYSNLVRQFEVG